MVIKEVELCDICEGDGCIKLAVVTYVGDEDETYGSCDKHLKDVIGAELKYDVIEGMEEEFNEALRELKE